MREFIGSMPRLHEVSFNIRTNTRQDTLAFNRALRKTIDWPGPRSLTFPGHLAEPIFNAIVRRFVPTTIEAVQLPKGVNKAHFMSLKKSPQGQTLKALHIDRTANRRRTRSLTPSFDHEFLQQRNNLVALIVALQRMRQLRRFAFTLWLMRLHKRLIQRDLTVSPLLNRAYTAAKIDEFYFSIVRLILGDVSTLMELCISPEHPIFYRGIRSEEGQILIRRESRENPGEEDRFPTLLLDLN
ncbi:hypothetical protein IL306_012610 [Fusarium sp. DS 682]|nr:hypothetical protein IL306_012610 [Fusarium sp. DS 682]